MLVRIILAGALAIVWMIEGTSASPAAISTQVNTTPAQLPLLKSPSAAQNSSSLSTTEADIERKRRREQRLKEKRERRRLKKLKRKRKRRQRQLLRQQQRGAKNTGAKNTVREVKKRKRKNKRRKKKKDKRRRKQRNKEKKRKGPPLTSEERKKLRKERKAKRRKRKNARRRNRRRRKNRGRKRGPVVPCKSDQDCGKAGPKHCCELITGRCVRPRGGLKCFGSCMCNVRKRTQNFLCVTKKKKYQKFLVQKKGGLISYAKPRGHCSNVTLSELKEPNHRYQQIL